MSFADLASADLIVDGLYEGGTRGTVADDPLAILLPVGNQGGFRYSGSPRARTVRLVALYTTATEVDWPDALDPQTGVFTYYGDNRRPGRELHDTQRAAATCCSGMCLSSAMAVPPTGGRFRRSCCSKRPCLGGASCSAACWHPAPRRSPAMTTLLRSGGAPLDVVSRTTALASLSSMPAISPGSGSRTCSPGTAGIASTVPPHGRRG